METPPPAPTMTAEQAADLKCVGVGLLAAEAWRQGQPPIVRVYLKRLRRTDASRDWLAMAPKFSDDMLYGEFMGLMNECADRLNKDSPTQPKPRG